jgi:heme/copper-type cytochrome/quinol oxidase subunit 1
MKHLFRLPELLLFLPLIVMLGWGNSSIDIHMHDTYWVIGNAGYTAVTLLLPLLFTTWVIHVLLRRRECLSGWWRWTQVGVTLFCAVAAGVIVVCLQDAMPRRYYSYSNASGPGAFTDLFTLYKLLLACVVTFLLCQLAFWITGTVLLLKRRRWGKP